MHSPNRRAPVDSASNGAPERYNYFEAVPFALAHLACFAAIFTGVHLTDLLIAAGLYAVRMFGVTAGYHRYFSHRSFKTSRIGQFLLAFLAQSSAQRGVLWWAAAHRRHHRCSDTDDDVHSPVRRGFWHAHLGWIFTDRYRDTAYADVPDLAKFPELMWLDRHPYLPAILTGAVVFACAGWSGLIVGFFWSTVALWHATFSINSLAHLVGRRRYLTGDQSRNNWWLALLTFGEGWHNNHHHYQSAACQGFRWYEVDFSYYALKALSLSGMVWDLQRPPRSVVRSERRLRRAVLERAASELAGSFQVEQIAADLRLLLAEKRASLDVSIQEIREDLVHLIESYQQQFGEGAESLRDELAQRLHTVELRCMPSLHEVRDRAVATFVRTPSLNDVAERARQILIDRLCEELLVREAVPVRAHAPRR